MIFAAFALAAFGLSECVTSTEAQYYPGDYYPNGIFDSSQCTIETDRIWRDSDFNDEVKEIYNYDIYYSDPDACIIDVATGFKHCTYDLSVLPAEVIKQVETLCHSYDGVFYLENHTNPYIVTDANESANGTSVFIESPQCYGLCTEDEVRDYFGATNVTLSAPRYGSERVNCTLETERILVDYIERMPLAITDIFEDESLCSNSTGARICHRDFSVLPIEVIAVAENECHDVGGVFYSVDSWTYYIDEEEVETITALPYCFGTCSEDQLVYLLEREGGVANAKLTKEPNEGLPKEDTSSYNCTLETERIIMEYGYRMPSAIADVFEDESLCSLNSAGAQICHRDFSVLPIEVITVAENECHDVGGVFYSVDGTTRDSEEEDVETITALPYCFGTCSEDQLIDFIEREGGLMNVRLTKEPNEEPPKGNTSSTSYVAGAFLASVLQIALLVFHL